MTAATRRFGIWLLAALLGAAAVLIWLGAGLAEPALTPPDLGGEPRETAAAAAAAGDAQQQVQPAREELQFAVDDAPGRDAAFVRALTAFAGRVLDPAGAPAAAAELTLLRIDPRAWLDRVGGSADAPIQSPELVAGTARSDDAGRFRIAGVWPRSFYVLRAAHGPRLRVTRLLSVSPGPGETVQLGDLILEARAALTGQVVDAGGSPVAGATVCAAPIAAHLLKEWSIERYSPGIPLLYLAGDQSRVLELPAWCDARIADLGVVVQHTDESGRFRIEGLPAGELALLVHAPDRLPRLQPAVPAAGGQETDLGQIALASGAALRGRVVDERGLPLPGAELLAGQPTAQIPFVVPARVGPSGADGRFVAHGFRPGQVVLAARRGPGAPWVLAPPQRIADECVVELPDSCELTLLLRSASGKTLEQPSVELVPAVADGDDWDLARLGMRTAVPLDDKLERLEGGRLRLRELQQGRYLLIVAARAHARVVRQVLLETDAEMVVELPEQTPFVVAVTGDDGEPVADALVSVQARGEFPRIPRLPIPCGCTDGDGRVTITQATSDRVLVRASHPAFGFVEQEIDLPATVVPLQLRAAGAIEGRLTERGRPPAEASWSVSLLRIEPRVDELFQVPRLARVDEAGRFVVRGLEPGTYELSAVTAEAEIGLGMFLEPHRLAGRFTARERRERVPVHAGRTTRIELELHAAEIAATEHGSRVLGTVDVNGRPGAGLEVRGWHQRWLSGRVGTDGRFDLGQVPAGTVGLYVVDPAAAQRGRYEVLWWQQVEIPVAPEAVVLEISLAMGSITGTVRSADGAPLAGCVVKASGSASAALGRGSQTKFYGVTDRDGGYSFPAVPAGVYQVSVWQRRDGRAAVDDVEVRRGELTAGVDLLLARVFRISGRVLLEQLGPQAPQWTWLRLYGKDEAGRYVSSERGCRVRSDGTFLLEGVPRGRYEVSIGAMFRAPGDAEAWNTRMFVHDSLLEVGSADLDGILLRPIPQPDRAPARSGK